VRLVSEADGQGGVEFFDYDLAQKSVKITRWNSAGQTTREHSLDGGK
jgi:hypothetical protein